MELNRRSAGSNEYLAAMSTVRSAKNWFLVMIALAIAVQLVSFAAVRWVGVIDRSTAVKTAVEARNAAARGNEPALSAAVSVPSAEPAAQTQSQTSSSPVTHKKLGRLELQTPEADKWAEALYWALPATKFTALVAGLLLSLTLLMATNLSLLGRTQGVAHFVSAFFWSLLLAALLIPWQQTLASRLFAGALYNLNDLIQATAQVTWALQDTGKTTTLLQEILYYLRFLGLPILSLALLLAVQSKFARGYKRTRSGAAEGDLGIGHGPDKI